MSLQNVPVQGAPHMPLAQSELLQQVLPTAQSPHGPPQSTSVSNPSRTPSEQVGAAQVPSHAAL